MLSNKRTLRFFTNGFPYGKGEQFIADEIPYLAQSFDKVIIYVSPKFGAVSPLNYELPTNFEVVQVDFNTYVAIRKVIFSVIIMLLNEIIFSADRKYYLKHLKKHLFIGLELHQKAYLLKQYFNKNEISCCYTYWFDHWTNVLSILKQQYHFKFKLVSRGHAFDIDEKWHKRNYFPYRYSVLKGLDKLVVISGYAKACVVKRFPKFADKIEISRLGVSQNSEIKECSKKQKQYLIVSCSFIHRVKRVSEIVELLSYIDLPIRWIHFGDGEQMEEVREKCEKLLKSNIEYELKGYTPNGEIHHFYKHNFIDAFVHLSELEGVPVALMEAGSYGIPLFAKDNTGVSDVVNQKTGQLVNEDIGLEKAAEMLVHLLQHKSKNLLFRNNVKSYITSKFDASTNHQEFIQQYLK